MFFSLPTYLRPCWDFLSVLQTSLQSETKGSICNVKIVFMTQNSQVGGVVKLNIWPELILRPFVWVIKTHPPPTNRMFSDLWRCDGILLWWHFWLYQSYLGADAEPGGYLEHSSHCSPLYVQFGPRYIKLSSGSSKFASWRTVLLLRMFGFYILIKV